MNRCSILTTRKLIKNFRGKKSLSAANLVECMCRFNIEKKKIVDAGE